MPPSRHSPLIVATIVFTLALGLRLHFLNAGLWHTDSVLQAQAVERTVLGGEFTYMHRPGYPGQVVLGALFFAVHHLCTGATSAYLAITVQSAVAGAAAAGLAVLVVHRIYPGLVAAGAAGVLVAHLPPLLATTTFAKSHGSQAALLLLAALLALRVGEERRLRGTLYAGLVLGLAVATRTDSLAVAPAILALLWTGRPLRGGALRARIEECTAFGAAALAVPLLLYAPQLAESGFDRFSEASADTRYLGPFSGTLPAALGHVAAAFVALGLPLSVAGLVMLWRQERGAAVALLLWFLVPLFVIGNTAILVPRHLIPAEIPLALAAAVPVGAMATAQREWVRVAAIAVPLLIVTWMFFGPRKSLERRSTSCPTADFARQVGERTPEDALVLAQDLHVHLDYYARRDTRFRAAFGERPREFARLADASIAAIAADVAAGRPVYVTSDAFTYDAPVVGGALLRVDLAPDLRGSGEETVGAWGTALLETFVLEHVLTTSFDDWHGASLGPREGAPTTQSLYRILPE